MKSVSSITISLLLVAAFGCEELFEFDVDEGSVGQLIVNGSINQGPGPYFVRVQQIRTSSTVPQTSVANACVELIDEQGRREECRYREDGNYVCQGEIVSGEPGKAYAVEVTHNGELFRSDFDTLPDNVFPHFEIEWEQGLLEVTSQLGIDSELDVVFISLESEVPATEKPLYLTWVGEEIYQFLQKEQFYAFQPPPPCYIIANYGSDQVRLLNNQEFTGTYRLPRTMHRELDDTFLRKRLFLVFQYSVSEGYYHYLKQIETLIENTGSLFDPPPGTAKGNIFSQNGDRPVHGYFRSVVADTSTIAIYPSQLKDVLIRDQCIYRFTIERCFGCPETGRYSSFDRPAYYHRIE